MSKLMRVDSFLRFLIELEKERSLKGIAREQVEKSIKICEGMLHEEL